MYTEHLNFSAITVKKNKFSSRVSFSCAVGLFLMDYILSSSQDILSGLS